MIEHSWKIDWLSACLLYLSFIINFELIVTPERIIEEEVLVLLRILKIE